MTAVDVVAQMLAEAPRVQVVIGDASVMLLGLRTTAPSGYDGFGTMTTYECQGEREVLVHQQHARWQVERYLSMLGHRVEASENPAEAIRDLLWDRLCGRAR